MDRSISLDSPASVDLSPDDDDRRAHAISSSSSPDPRGAFYRVHPPAPARSSYGSGLVDAQEDDRTSTSSSSSSSSGGGSDAAGLRRQCSAGDGRGASRGSARGGSGTARGRREEVTRLTRLEVAAPDEFRGRAMAGPPARSGGAQRVGRFTLRQGRRAGDAAGDAPRARDERPGRSEQSSCSDRSTVVQEEQDIELLRQQVSDLGKQLWQMHKEHEKEKSKMMDEFEAKLKEAQADNAALINKLREQLREKDRRLKESCKRADQLEWQVEDLQLKMQNAMGIRQPYGTPIIVPDEGVCMNQKSSSRRRVESSEEVLRSHSDTQKNASRQRGLPPRSLTESNMSSGDFPQGGMLNSYSEAVPAIPPKHLQQFSPLTMRRRLWTAPRGAE